MFDRILLSLMFALAARRVRLATSLPFLRPPIRASYSEQVPRPPPTSPDTSFSPPPSTARAPEFSDFLRDLNTQNPDQMDQENPDSTPATPGLARDYRRDEFGPAYRFHCHSTRTNTINTFTDPDGNALAWVSGGSAGFRKRNRSTYEAGYQCAVRMFAKIEQMAAEKDKLGPNHSMKIDLFCKGFGLGRDALFKALTTAQGDGVRTRIVSITDRTPIKIGGTRSRKRKRR